MPQPSPNSAIPEIGTIIDGKFRVDGHLGTGGMAVVLAATHLQLEQRVAIKILLPACLDDPEVVSRFLLEGRSASKIRSEHVVRILDVGVEEERPYLVMEYLDGTDLDALIVQGGPLPTVLAVDYLLQACEAIAEAHVNGIVHRDLKPANLFLTHRADGAACVKVLDFGISKAIRAANSTVVAHETSPLLIMGSPHYMSPEQMKSLKSVDQRSDLWSLGAILHELVAGSAPFQGSSITALCAAIMMEPPPPLLSLHGEVPPALAAVVRRCLEKDPAHRFANVAELASALAPLGSAAARVSATCIERVLGGASETARYQLPAVPAVAFRTALETLADGAPAPRARGSYFAAALAVLVACCGVGWVVIHHHRAASAFAAEPAAEPAAAPPQLAPAAVIAPPEAPTGAAASQPPPTSGPAQPTLHRHVAAAPPRSPHAPPAIPASAGNSDLPAPAAVPSASGGRDPGGSGDNPY